MSMAVALTLLTVASSQTDGVFWFFFGWFVFCFAFYVAIVVARVQMKRGSDCGEVEEEGKNRAAKVPFEEYWRCPAEMTKAGAASYGLGGFSNTGRLFREV